MPRWRSAAADALPVAVALLALFPLHNNDLWWHLATGRWMVENVAVPRTDPFSWTLFLESWVDNEWLGQLLFYGLWQAGGLGMLIAARAAVYATLALLVRAYTRALGAPDAFVPAVVTAVALSHHWWALRPSVFSLIALLTMLILVERERERFLPLLFLVWANTHPGFFFGLGVLGAMALVRRRLWLVLPWCVLITLVNPYGWRVYEQQLEIAQNRAYRALLDEWVRPPWQVTTLAIAGGLCGLLSFRRVAMHRLVPLIAASVLATTAIRFGEYLAWIAAPIFFSLPVVRSSEGWRAGIPYLAVFMAMLAGWMPPAASAAIAAAPHYQLLAARQHFASMVVGALMPATRPQRHWLEVALVTVVVLTITVPMLRETIEPGRYPTRCLNELPAGGRVFHKMAWGGWLIWNGHRSFIDGRCSGQPLFFYWNTANAKHAERYLGEWNITHVLGAPTDGVVRQIKDLPEWTLVCEDEASQVFARRTR